VLELATPTQDLVVFAPEAIFEPLLAQAIKNHGVCHLLFHPAHFHRDEVANAMANAIRRGKEAGLEWWTGRQINAWERSRRKVRITRFKSESSRTLMTLESPDPLSEATVLWFSGSKEATLNLADQPSAPFEAWGFTFQAVIATLHEKVTAASVEATPASPSPP
jgi:hypothetical protein